MDIVYCLDDNYKLYTAVSIYSLLSNKNEESEYIIHILHHPDLDIHYFDKLQQHFNIQFDFIDMGDTAKDLYVSRHIKTPTYYKLYISEVLPDLDRCIYLDGDTIILKDLTELYNTDLGDNIIGGVLDISVGYGKRTHPLTQNRKFRSSYINTGTMLLNLKLFKQNYKKTTFINYLIKNPILEHHVQDIINYCLNDKIKLLNFKYNVPNSIDFINDIDFKMNLFNYFKDKSQKSIIHEITEAYNNPIIIHYFRKPDASFNVQFNDYWVRNLNCFLKIITYKSEDYIICCNAKNESYYISEWVNYHLNLGFDHIYIYNNDDDQTILHQLLGNNNKVTLFDKQNFKNIKYYMLNDAYVNINFKWCAFIDCDEFITLHGYIDIKDYINSFPEDCQQICLNWLCYGSNGNKKYNPIPIQKRMPFCGTPIESIDYNAKQPINSHVKSIVKKTINLKSFVPNQHTITQNNAYTNNGLKINEICYRYNLNYDVAYVKHYYVRDLKNFWFSKTQQRDDCPIKNTKLEIVERIYRSEFMEYPSLPPQLLQLANIQVKNINELIGKKILCKNQEKLIPILKKNLNVLYCGDLANNNIFINIANYNKCYYNWVLPELFNNVYKETDFDLIIE